jgi:methanogenic corrinoid protein MtbC1
MPMPGEQHSFGLIMVAEFFRRAGWDVWDLHPSSLDDVLTTVRRQCFSIVGVSLSCETRLGELPGLISAIRLHSRNQSVGIMVGGQPFIAHPERVLRIGADCTAVDGGSAPQAASRLVHSLQRPG